jgi:Tol biopolymer transport system component/C-terminal processing protease CtpA/Prc
MRIRNAAVVLALFLLLAPTARARAEEARWIRYPAVSPDGSQVAFCARGDLWVVPIGGGAARPLTAHVAHERSPVWASDGRSLAFASDRHGNYDVFVVGVEGGAAKRLTFHSSDDLPSDFTPDGTAVLFSSRRQDAPQAAIGSSFLPELYLVPATGGRPRQVLTTPALSARYHPDGRQLAYEDLKGYENEWRKHHTSSVTRDLWVYDAATGRHARVTRDPAEDRTPVWSADGTALLYLSERGGSFEVWRRAPVADAAPTRVTNMGPHPVRFLSVARNGGLVFTYGGELWTKPRDAEPVRIPVSISTDDHVNPVRRLVERKGATELAVSPDAAEVAFVLRGEVFVTSVEHDTTKRITHTVEQERGLSWMPDGRSLVYASERDGSWNLYRATLAREEEDAFSRATRIAETPLLVTEAETFAPRCSPDGKLVAYLLDRDAIAVLDVATGTSRTVVPADRNYSYTDGDIAFEWSPDGRWLAFTMMETGRWIGGIGVVNLASGEIVNVTRSGYEEGDPHWNRDGTVLTFSSDRHGRRNHASWGSESDVLGLYLTEAAFDRARLTEEEFDVLEEKKDDKDAHEGERESRKRDQEKAPPEPVEIDFEGLDDRVRRLTIHAAPMGDHALSPDGETLVYLARVGETWGLWTNRIRKSETKKVLDLGKEHPGRLELAEDGRTTVAFVLRGNGTIAKAELRGLESGGRRGGRGAGPDSNGDDGGRGARGDSVAFEARLTVDGPAERSHLFQHVWRQARDKFYDPELHGVDWEGLEAHYAALLPHVANGPDFAELLSELLGELNASHTGARYRPRDREGDETAALGLLYDTAWQGDGLRVAEVLDQGPADKATSTIEAGTIVTAIDGEPLSGGVNPWSLLDRKAGRPVLLTLASEAGGDGREEVLRPITLREESNLLYERWVRGREALTDRLSAGRIGYVHVRGMGDGSFRRIYRDALGKHGAKAALVLDTRFNGGGWLHDDLVTFLGGEEYAWFVPRGKARGLMGAEPARRWARPVAVLQNEGNYSDAHFFPYAFTTLDLGKLVGTPVAGTATAVWWERLMDPDLVFGIPQVGMQTKDGRYLENLQLDPDALVFNDPESVARGEDKQLEAAVRVLLEDLPK